MDAYCGNILSVNFNESTLETVSFPLEWKKHYLGGRGLGSRIITDLVEPSTDPLSAENVLVFATGPLTGTGVPLGSRYMVCTKSPLTGTLSSANSGGLFGWKMKKAGFDAVVIRGRAEAPCYLHLDDGHARIRDASPYWGMTVSKTTAALTDDISDSRAGVACIGPAGERLSPISCIMNEETRAAGRGGMGAVMGSKNLKAIVATGSQAIGVANPDHLDMIKDRVREKVTKNGIEQALKTYGTAVLVNIINANHILPTRNFQSAIFPAADKVSGEEMSKTILKKRKGCYACIVQCGRVTEVDGETGEGPEYESIWAFGPDCGIDDLPAIAKANNLCNELGLDTISTGSTIACLMEMAERNIVDHPIRFGDAQGMLELVRLIGYREGIGDELAEGSLRFAGRYGNPELSMSVKGQELPAYDPRGLQGHGLQYATSVRGGCHVYGYMISPEVLGSPEKLDPYVDEGKAEYVKIFQDLTAAIDASGMCLFSSFALDAHDYADLVTAATGIDMDAAALLLVGERIWNLQKLFNLKAGLSRTHDTLPERLLSQPLAEGAPSGRVWDPAPLMDEYYHARGWDDAGVPSLQKLQELELP